MSNDGLAKYVEEFVSLLSLLSRSPDVNNAARAAMGIISLHRFGYQDFSKLARLFDRVIPQMDLEYVKFTSWCAGRLVHHPGNEQSSYVKHLIERLIGWIRGNGRRARHLAAVYLLEAISSSAGADAVYYFEPLQTAIWHLVSHPSMQLIRATADALNMFTRAIIRYRRSELESYLGFFEELCIRLLSFGSHFKEYASLKILEQLIKSSPGYFGPKICELYEMFAESSYNSPLLVRSQAFITTCCLSFVDSKQFIDLFGSYLFDTAKELAIEFPHDIISSLCQLIDIIPDHISNFLTEIKSITQELVFEPNCALKLMTKAIEVYKSDMFPIDRSLLNTLFDMPMSKEYNHFIVFLSSNMKDFSKDGYAIRVFNKIKKELITNNSYNALDLISKLPSNAIVNEKQIIEMLLDFTKYQSEDTRRILPEAIFHLTFMCNSISTDEMIHKMFQLAMFDHSTEVRCSILSVLSKNAPKSLASSQSLRSLQLFANDDSTTVKTLVFKIIAAIANENPVYVNVITRHCILESFFIIKHSDNIRVRSRIIKTLPDLINASSSSMQIYAGPFMAIANDLLSHIPDKNQEYNFLEIAALTKINIGIINSISLIAPIAPDIVSRETQKLIPILCSKLTTGEDRLLILSVLKLLFVLLSPPSSTLMNRMNVPIILSSCSQFLSVTHSRKARIAVLKVIGAIGVLEAHQRPPSNACETPDNVDESLLRQFFHSSRDTNTIIDDTLLLQQNSTELCFTAIISNSLMKILKNEDLKDLYQDTIYSLVSILKSPKMPMLSYFDSFMSRFFDILDNATDYEMENYIPYMTQMVQNSSNNTIPFISRALSLIINRFNEKLSIPLLDLVLAFVQVMCDGFAPYASDTISLLVQYLDSKKTTNYEICSRILSAFAIFGIYASDLLYLLIPQICDVILCEMTLQSIRLCAIESIESLSKSTDLFIYLGPICRALGFSIELKEKKTGAACCSLLSSLVLTQGNEFLSYAQPLIDSIKMHHFFTNELEQAIEQASIIEGFSPLIRKFVPQTKPKDLSVHIFSEDAIIARALSPTLGQKRRIQQWLHSFIITVIASSPSSSIRACSTIATNYQPLSMWIFKIAFFSCWKLMTNKGRSIVSNCLRGVLLSNDNFDSVVNAIIDLVFFMQKFEPPLSIPVSDLLSCCQRYGCDAFGLHLQQSLINESESNTAVLAIIDLFVRIGDWDNAIGMWKKYSSNGEELYKPEVLSKLSMWDKVQPQYEAQYKNTKDLNSLQGLTRSLAAMAMWPEVMSLYPDFKELSIAQRRNLTPYFGQAAYHLGDWSSLEEILKSQPDDSVRCMTLSALSDLYKGDYSRVDERIEQAFSLLASRPITFWADNQKIHKTTMLFAQQLIEVSELKTLQIHPSLNHSIGDVWYQRLQMSPRDFELWFRVLANRARIAGIRDSLYIDFFQMKSLTMGTKMHENAFNVLFPGFNPKSSPDLDRLCYVVMHWTIGEKERAKNEMKDLANSIKSDWKYRCHEFYSTWLLETNDSKSSLLESYYHLMQIPIVSSLLSSHKMPEHTSIHKTVRYVSSNGSLYIPKSVLSAFHTDFNNISVLRKWSDANTLLASLDPLNQQIYIVNSIEALAYCSFISPSFTDVVQLLNIFFDHANNEEIFNLTATNCISRLSPRLLIKVSPQLLVQLSHSSLHVSKFVHQTIFALLEKHYHALIFSLIVMQLSKNQSRARAASAIYEQFSLAFPLEAEEVSTIRQCLLHAAVTWFEEALQLIGDALDHYSNNKIERMSKSLQSLLSLTQSPECQLHHQFLKQYRTSMESLEQLMRASLLNNTHIQKQVLQWCHNMRDSISEDIKSIKIIQLSAVSEEISKKTHFRLAVPGTYSPKKEAIRIQYFVGQFNVYKSKQQPKDVIIRGEDGNFYQYLVKGHEDLRLDERIMQFFRLINSFVKKESCFNGFLIHTMAVVPLSMYHGLVQWVPGTDTLRSVVDQYRKLYGRDELEEYNLIEQLSYLSYDSLLPIQKMQILDKLNETIPDTDIANFFRLKAENAESWLKLTRTFAISTAMNSIIGYVIGLGDRHPGNLLINRYTGKVIHIDFGDCFERAAKRKLLPEVVPFRLTRMMVKAMGITETEGAFRTTFTNMAYLLREYRKVLVMVLSIFVHEPLVDPDDLDAASFSFPSRASIPAAPPLGSVIDKSRVPQLETNEMSIEMRNRVNQKLIGTDFGNENPSTVEEQASHLINFAANKYNLAKMYSGWCPFW